MNIFLTVGRMARFLAVLVGLSFVVVGPAFCLDDLADNKDKRVSFEFRGQSMAEVANRISEQLNYKVLMDDELASVSVSGKFNNVTLDDFFSRRIFRGKNVAILFDDKEHIVIISFLGKKSSMTEYDRTNHAQSVAGSADIDPLDMEVNPGVKRRDVVMVENDMDPLDMEVNPGVKRRDVVMVENDMDPLDMEVNPGVKRRDVVAVENGMDPLDMEVNPGVKRRDVVMVENGIDPLDMEVHPGIKRRDVVHSHLQ